MSDWVSRVAKQEEEVEKKMLANKMKELQLRHTARQSSADSSAGEGWPTLPPETEARDEGGFSSQANKSPPADGWPNITQDTSVRSPGASATSFNYTNSPQQPALGGVGRGKSFKLPGSNQTDGVGGFAALGSGNGGSQSFGQFGGFNNSPSQPAASNQSANRFGAAVPNGSKFNFKSAADDSKFKSNSNANTSFGGFGTFGNASDNKTSSTSNWPQLQSENRSQPTASGWPSLDNDSNQNSEANATESFTRQSDTAPKRGEREDDEVEKPMENAEISYLNKILHDKLVNTKYDVEIERQNPNNPLFSVKSFEELRLSDELLQGVYEMGFKYPSKIQESALPALLADPPQNMIAQSQSGTGKTAAFVLTMLSRVEPGQQYPQCLCLSPTYELAVQIGKVVEQMGKYLTNVKVAYAVRGTRLERGAKVNEQIVIGTPGTVLDWMLRFRFFDPKMISVFVLDEADLMIGIQGHQDQSIRIHKLLSNTCQHLLFSATYDDQIMDFAYKIISDPVVIRLRREEETLDYIKQYYVTCREREEKYSAVCTLYGTLTIGQAIIFCRTKREASWLAGKMSTDGHAVSLLTGELTIEQRGAIFDRFKRGQEKVLISTNVTARGIDVQQVNIVINYDLPTTTDGQPDYEAYLHRIGRSGRFGKAGIAINFIDSNWSRNLLDQIEAHFGKKIMPLDVEDVDALERIESWD